MTKPRSAYQYPPIDALSHERRMRLTVHPAPGRGWRDIFRSPHYEHQLFEAEVAGYRAALPSEHLRWRHERPSACPWAGFVHDDGSCAVLHADDELIFVDPKGTLTGACNVLSLLRRDLLESGSFRERTSTAGTFWTAVPAGLFVETAQGLRFVLRLERRLRVCFDPATATRDREAEKSVDFSRAERIWILDSLQSALEQGDLPRAGAMALFAGQDGLTDAIPLILSLESRASSPDAHIMNSIWSATRSRDRLRAQTALVRLGADFEPSNAFQELAQPRPDDWHAALVRVRPGMTSKEIFQAAGAPFFDGHVENEAVWEYDVRMGDGYRTFRLLFSDKRLREVRWVGEAFREPHRDDAPE
ncbi:hypothetical protein [Polyangium sp. 15x6]|uniref:hypothetical protein n=1 Tax=Polyangium sp. 15x6 TaxID=3042687 RepID=UPI00249AB416|nr:hypothetical protein [Polyangium sp. 15x6]MDI3288786.1 hypothetical protein [Polyangium sp. 15x6]